jgi:hypothetical protein
MTWYLDDVSSWIEQLEQCPPGGVGDGYAKDINTFLNDLHSGALQKALRELRKRGQKAVVDYQKRKKGFTPDAVR